MFLNHILSVVLLTSSFVLAGPGPCTGDCNVHDPTIIRRADGQYFRFSTGHKLAIAQSSTLSGPWKNVGAVLPAGSKINIPGKDDPWAPDISILGNTFYLFYAVSQFGSQNSAIGVATSSNCEPGSWTDHGAVGVSSGSDVTYNAIDPQYIKTGDDSLLTFGSFFSGIQQVKMKTPPMGAAGAPFQIAFDPAGTHAIEGGFVWWHAPYFYLFFSAGTCCGLQNRPPAGQEYHIRVCRSSVAGGAYVDRSGKDCRSGGGETILASGGSTYAPGGQSIFYDSAQNAEVLVYHYVDTNIGYADNQKRFGWNVLHWNDGWPSV